LTEVNEEDVERLASRLAMLVSEEGEAENAARAVSHLARKLGMTGGELKEMFLAGALSRPMAAAPHTHPQPHARPGEADRLEREIATLRHSLRQQETDRFNAERERDAMYSEVEHLRGALFKIQTMARAQRVIGAVVVVAIIVAGAIGYMVPVGRHPVAPVAAPQDETASDPEATPKRFGTVRNARTFVYRDPDRASPVIASLTEGSSVVVYRVLWNMLMQWAEVEVGSGIGYVLTTDIDLS
jgi:hypothetical protein